MQEFTTKEIKSIVSLFYISFPKLMNYSFLASKLGFSSSDTRFIKIKRWLLEEGILEELGKFGGSKRIEINLKKLKEQIPEIPFIKDFHNKFIKGVWNKEIWVFK